MDDHLHAYEVLGLKPEASPDEVKQAYRDLVKVWHPDRFNHDERLQLRAQEKLKELNGAYKVLEAYFFEASAASDIAESSESVPNPESRPSEVTSSPTRHRTVLVAALCAMALVVTATGLVWLLRTNLHRAESRATVPGTGAPRYALQFDGNQSYVAITTTGSLTGTFTAECWALSRSSKPTETILCSRGPKDYSFDIKFRQGKRFHGDIGDGSLWLAKMANATFRYNPGVWYHLAYVVTPTNYSILVNGDSWEKGPIYPAGNPLLYDANHLLRLGMDGIDSDPLKGCIAEVRVWNTARTREQIQESMNATLTGDEPGLQGYWRFDEGSGTKTSDSSGHGFTGILIGDVMWTTNVPPLGRRE